MNMGLPRNRLIPGPRLVPHLRNAQTIGRLSFRFHLSGRENDTANSLLANRSWPQLHASCLNHSVCVGGRLAAGGVIMRGCAQHLGTLNVDIFF